MNTEMSTSEAKSAHARSAAGGHGTKDCSLLYEAEPSAFAYHAKQLGEAQPPGSPAVIRESGTGGSREWRSKFLGSLLLACYS